MNILHVIASPMGNESQSIKLGNAIVEKIKVQYPNATLQICDLNASPFPHLEENHISAFYSTNENRTPQQALLLQKSDEAVAELLNADIIIISTPMYNFGVPSSLKAWVDHIVRDGVTFCYSDAGPEGLAKNKKAYLGIAAGGVYSEGADKEFNFTEPYLKAVLGFVGITDVTAFSIEGLSIPGISENATSKGLQAVSEFSF